MAEYAKNPTQKNYEKVFGTKNNIYARVKNYNKSQQTGAEAVKTTAKVGAGLAIGAATVATGGTAGALLLTAAGTTMASAAIDETDRLNVKDAVTKGKINFRAGTDHKKIMTNAAFDGISTLAGGAVGKVALTTVKGASTGSKIARAAINTTGDVGVGAAQEYVETGHVTARGIISNAAMSGIGGVVVSGTLRGVGKSVKLVKGKTKSFKAQIPSKTTTNKAVTTTKATMHNNNAVATKNISPIYNENGEMLAGGSFFQKFSASNLFGRSKTKLSPSDLMKHAENNIANQIKLGDPGTVHVSRKLKEELSSPTIAKEFPSEIDLNNINSHIKSGEVCAVGSGTNQKLYVNNNGTAQEIQLSRETFDRLFPQGGFAMTSQKANNNCWILSRINAMTGSNTGKAELYSMFKELPNGDVQILLPNGSKPITFPKGKPLATMSAKQIQEGGAPGVEMLQQTVQAKRIQLAEKTPISNIEDCGIEKLNAEENRMGLDTEATAMILDKNKFTTKTINNNQYADLENTLSTFSSKDDMGTVTFEAHARTLVDYNPRTKMVTYHNPYNGGVDITCPLGDLKKKSAHFAISRLKQSTNAKSTTTQTVSEQAQNVAQQATTKPKTEVDFPNDKPVTRTANIDTTQTISSQPQTTHMHTIQKPTEKTNIIKNNFREIAKTADGRPINAMISSNSVVINKNGNNLEIPLSEIKTNSFYKNSKVSLYCVKETSTNSYIVIEADKYGTISTRSIKNDDEMYKLMDELDKQAKPQGNTTTTRVDSDNINTNNNTPQSQPVSATPKKRTELSSKNTTPNKPTRIAVPKGFIVNKEINGKRTLISTDGNARVLMERNGRWMEMDNKGRFREYKGN